MGEYIEREAVCNDCNNLRICTDKSRCPVGRAAAADVAPVVHSQWEVVNHYPYPDTIRCSVCGREFGGNEDWVRCPVCETKNRW